MKVNHTTIFMGDDTLRARHGEQSNHGASGRKAIDGSAFQAKLDPIAAKKEEAKKHPSGGLPASSQNINISM